MRRIIAALRKSETHNLAAFAVALICALLLGRVALADTDKHLPLSVVTYNIRSGANGIENVAKVIAQQRPDVVFLQEVHGPSQQNGFIDQAEFLGRTLNMHVAFSKSRYWVSGEYGLCILSRFPILNQSTVALPGVSGEEPEIILKSAIDTPLGPVYLMNTHLHSRSHSKGNRGSELRQTQAQALLEEMRASPSPLIFGGDLNTFGMKGEGNFDVRKMLRREFVDLFEVKGRGRAATFPAKFPVVRLDYIFLKGEFRPWEARVISSRASDHRPLWGRLDLLAPPVAFPQAKIPVSK